MKTILSLICLLTCTTLLHAQQQLKLNWLDSAQLYYNGGDFVAESVTNCSDGSIVVAGYFDHTVDFDTSPDTFNLTAVSKYDIFIAKYSNKGALIYAHNFGSVGGTLFEKANSVVVDKNDNAYVTGSFTGTVDFNAGKEKTILSAPLTSTNNFLACFDKNGKLKFAKNITDTKEEDKSESANSVALDKSTNIYVTGTYSGQAEDFDPGAGIASPKSKGYDIFIAKYDSAGNFIFVKSIGGASHETGNKIAVDGKNNILVCGNFTSGSIDFDPGTSSNFLYLKGQQDIFFAKYDSAGNYLFAKNIGGIKFDDATGLAAGTDNNFVITGKFYGKQIDFDPGKDSSHLLNSRGSYDAFIAKYNKDGDCLFAFNIGSGDGDDIGVDVSLDSSNNVFATGSFTGSKVDFDPGPDTFNIKNTGYGYDYIAKYGPHGKFLFAEAIGNYDPQSNTYSSLNCLHVTQNGNVLTSGYFNHQIDVDAGADSVILTSPASTMLVAVYDNDGNYVGSIEGGDYFNYYNASTTIKASITDKEGNVYITGEFNGRYDFDPGPGKYILESLEDYRSSIYFAKYSSSGKLVFAKAIIGPDPVVGDLAVDKDENIYLTGQAGSDVDFDPTDSVQHLYNGDSTGKKITDGYFYAKYDRNGNLVFAKGEGINWYAISFNAIAVDKSDNIYLAGTFGGSLDFDPGPNKYILSGGGNGNIFYAKYDADGNFTYAYAIGNRGSNGSTADLKLDNKGNLVMTGQFNGQSVDFDPGPGVYYLNGGSGPSGFISKYKNNGDFVLAMAIEGSVGYTETGLTSLTIDNNNNIYVAGKSYGNVDFDPSNSVAELPDPKGMCFASYTSTGSFRFLKGILEYTSSAQQGNYLSSITVDKVNNMYVCGEFGSKDIDCDPGPDTALLINPHYDQTNNSYTPLFISKYDSLGNYMYAYDFNADSSAGYRSNYSAAINVDETGNIDYTGNCSARTNFSTGAKKKYLPATSLEYNLFIAQYKQVDALPKISNSNIDKVIAVNSNISLYPNPVSSVLTINNLSSNNNYQLKIINAGGNVVAAKHINNVSSYQINVQGLSAGVYYINIISNNSQLTVLKFVKE